MRFRVHPCQGLEGEITPDGYKHATLPIIAASLLSDAPVELEGIPATSDVEVLCEAIRHLGGRADLTGNSLSIDASGICKWEIPRELASRMRGTYLFMPALISRCGRFAVPQPGGDQIGDRTLEFGLQVMREMGAVAENKPVMTGRAERLKGTVLRFGITNDLPSVTKIGLIAGSMARGVTILYNPFQSPEITDLGNFLNAMGADISGTGTDTIVIVGKERLAGGRYRIMPDPLEAGTFLAACGMIGGRVTVRGISPETMPADLLVLKHMGMDITTGPDFITARSPTRLSGADFRSGPFPEMNTDVAPIFVALAALARGASSFEETVWEDRWGYVLELQKMGAHIAIDGQKLSIKGVDRLKGRQVTAGDLRAAALLTLAGLAAEGVTEVLDAHLAFRGYARFNEKLAALGASIEIETE
jgi:UDP-N-acetylglucosamine 1-carboxyvinyltransferase